MNSSNAKPPCPSPTPGVYSNSCPLSRWCHPAISSSVVPFSSCSQSLPASGSFPMSQLFVWGGWSIGVSASASVLPMNTQDWSPLGWTDWRVQGTLKSLLQHHSSKASVLQHSVFLTVHLSHPYMTTGKTITLTRWTFVGKVMSVFFNMLSRLVITCGFYFSSIILLCTFDQEPSKFQKMSIQFLKDFLKNKNLCLLQVLSLYTIGKRRKDQSSLTRFYKVWTHNTIWLC